MGGVKVGTLFIVLLQRFFLKEDLHVKNETQLSDYLIGPLVLTVQHLSSLTGFH